MSELVLGNSSCLGMKKEGPPSEYASHEGTTTLAGWLDVGFRFPSGVNSNCATHV
jgi:hypothetical protein